MKNFVELTEKEKAFVGGGLCHPSGRSSETLVDRMIKLLSGKF